MANNKDYIDGFLDDQEREYLRQFYENEVMREALRKVLLAGIYQNGTLRKGKAGNPLFNGAFGLVSNKGEFSNEQLGADIRAAWEGVSALENAFNQISKYVPEKEPERPTKNPAR
jgi:hypothetical protein